MSSRIYHEDDPPEKILAKRRKSPFVNGQCPVERAGDAEYCGENKEKQTNHFFLCHTRDTSPKRAQ